jgi:hypothetical protein
MPKEKLAKVPTGYLPENWQVTGAKEFNCSSNKIERIVYGMCTSNEKNLAIWEFMIRLAEKGKAEHDEKLKNLSKRVNTLAS